MTVPARTGPVRTGPSLRTRQQLISPRFRSAAIVIAAACVIAVGVLGGIFHHGSTPDALDRAVFRVVWPHRTGLDPLSAVGDTVPMGLLTVVLCYCCLALRRYRGAIMVALAVPIASGITWLQTASVVSTASPSHAATAATLTPDDSHADAA